MLREKYYTIHIENNAGEIDERQLSYEFDTFEEAEQCRKELAEYYGDFAKLTEWKI